MKDSLPSLSNAAQNFQHGIYEHYKRKKKYRTLCIAHHSETLEEMVVYEGLYDDHSIFVRPLTMFLEKVNEDGKLVPRFHLLDKG